MTRVKLCIPVLLLCVCLLHNEAKAGEMLAWEDCVREARKKHPDLVSSQEGINQATANRAITRSDMLPQVRTELKLETSDTANRGETDTYAYGITAEQLLFDGFKTSYDVRSAAENIRSAEYNYKVVSSNVRFRLRVAFVELLKAQELLKITEEIVQRRRQNAELVALRYEAGIEHRGSLLTAQANLGQAEFDVAQARRNISLAQRRLTKELGREKFIPMLAKGDLDTHYVRRERVDFKKLAERNPALQELITRKEAARFDLLSAKRDFFPEVFANAGAGKTDSDWPPEDDEWSVGLTVSFPLFEGGSRIAEVSRASAALGQTQADERSGRDSVILALEETWTDLQDAIERVRVRQKFFEATSERSKIARAQYANGLISFNNWTIIEDDLVRDQKALLESQSDALNAEASWVQAKGGTLEDDEE